MNMGQITQIAFELRNLTQAQLDEEDSDAEEETTEQVLKRQEMAVWQKFCQNKINKIKSEIKNKEDEKAYYAKQKAKKEEERKKLDKMKGKVGSDIASLNSKIKDLEKNRDNLIIDKAKKEADLNRLHGEWKQKISKLK